MLLLYFLNVRREGISKEGREGRGGERQEREGTGVSVCVRQAEKMERNVFYRE